MALRIGLAGTQFIGNVYAHSLRQVAGAEIAAVASPNTAEAFAERWGIGRHYADYREMIAAGGLDAIAIGAPNDLHNDIAIRAAAAGLHVLCEKPLAMSLAEADRMIAACDRAGVVLMYAENLLFAPMYRRVRDLVRRGRVGRPFLVKQVQGHGGPYPAWFWDVERAGGGALLDMGCHSIHAVCRAMDAWPEGVTATLGRYIHGERGRGEDHATVILHFPGGAIGMAESSWAMPGGNDSLEVYGPGGRLVANLERGPAIAAYSFAGTEESTHGGPRGGWHYETYEDAWQFGFPQEIQHFVDVIEGRAGLESSGEDGRRVLEIICAAYESARLRARVALPFASTARKPIEHWWG